MTHSELGHASVHLILERGDVVDDGGDVDERDENGTERDGRGSTDHPRHLEREP